MACFLEQVGVGVESHARAGVAEDAGDLNDVEADVDDQVAGERVAEIVEAHPPPVMVGAGPGGGATEDTLGDVVVQKRRADAGCEHEVGGASEARVALVLFDARAHTRFRELEHRWERCSAGGSESSGRAHPVASRPPQADNGRMARRRRRSGIPVTWYGAAIALLFVVWLISVTLAHWYFILVVVGLAGGGWYWRRASKRKAAERVEREEEELCFRPEEKVSVQQWNTWLQDVLPTRIADGSGNLRETPYASGTTTNCDDPAEPAHAGKASQLGLRTHSSNSSCLVATWQDLADYYYPTSWAVYGPAGTNGVNGTDIFGTLAPPVPVTSYSASGGALTLNFRSHVDGQNTAWKFYLQHLTSSGWRTFKIVKWRHSTRSVPESYTFTPSGCMRYRVKAVNPVNGSAIATTTAAAFTPAGTGLSSAGQCTL